MKKWIQTLRAPKTPGGLTHGFSGSLVPHGETPHAAEPAILRSSTTDGERCVVYLSGLARRRVLKMV